jgi:hypothetical protein
MSRVSLMIPSGVSGDRELLVEKLGQAGIAGDPRGVGQQVLDRHLRPRRWRIGVVFRDRIVDRQLALVDQLQDRRGGELLGDGAEAELGVGGVGDIPFAVGRAEALAPDRRAVLGHQDRAAEALGFQIRRDQFTRLFGVVGRGAGRRGGQGGTGRQQARRAEQYRELHQIDPLAGRTIAAQTTGRNLRMCNLDRRARASRQAVVTGSAR